MSQSPPADDKMAESIKRPASVLEADDSERQPPAKRQTTAAAASHESNGSSMLNGTGPRPELQPQPQPQSQSQSQSQAQPKSPPPPQPIIADRSTTSRASSEIPAEEQQEQLKAMDPGELLTMVYQLQSALATLSAQHQDVVKQLVDIKACLTVFFSGGSTAFESAHRYMQRLPTSAPIPTVHLPQHHGLPGLPAPSNVNRQARTPSVPAPRPAMSQLAASQTPSRIYPPMLQNSFGNPQQPRFSQQGQPPRAPSFSAASTTEVASAAVAAAAAAASSSAASPSNTTPGPATEWGTPPPPPPAGGQAPFMRINSPARTTLKLEFPPELGGMPRVLAYSSLHTVGEIWQEYKYGLDGVMSIEAIENHWQSRWRPDPKGRTWFSRRKLVWDKIREYMHDGLDEDAAVAAVEAKRATRSMHFLITLLSQERKNTKREWKKNAAEATAEKKAQETA
ncbi:hypothetical protein MAPG_06272 [Magnaporthiopsis poae ATCC 64411]|uniref:Transcription activator GCR1-like domain-containing protein n=1 Tax=Magnaporthiopsis poae (strain ATCC 64411 / 73-15) TaxID=644358 RepID=A0A0C4E1K8_MAGP6|nr:hypothetical protein MAPG_06272 [Magnaporthiopsis poae ATCC 64411]